MTATAVKERPAVGAQPKAARKQKRTFIAKPVRGKIDFKALRQSITARFPKTIAYLAK
jgi:hypothetical protein